MSDISYPEPPAFPAGSLVQQLRRATRDLHARAERTGIVASILAGTATRSAYAVYLRNLLPVYQAMEHALEQYRDTPGIGALTWPALYRAPGIIADIAELAGPGGLESLPLLPAAERYAARIAWAGAGDGGLLLAHAYTRYLGDLSGGQILARRLGQIFGPDFQATAFMAFPGIGDVAVFAKAFRARLNDALDLVADPEGVVREALVAFDLNIALSCEVADAQCQSDKRCAAALPALSGIAGYADVCNDQSSMAGDKNGCR